MSLEQLLHLTAPPSGSPLGVVIHGSSIDMHALLSPCSRSTYMLAVRFSALVLSATVVCGCVALRLCCSTHHLSADPSLWTPSSCPRSTCLHFVFRQCSSRLVTFVLVSRCTHPHYFRPSVNRLIVVGTADDNDDACLFRRVESSLSHSLIDTATSFECTSTIGKMLGLGSHQTHPTVLFLTMGIPARSK